MKGEGWIEATKVHGWKIASHPLWRSLTARCADCGHVPYRKPWRYLRRPLRGVRLRGRWYCRPECLQRAVAEMLDRQNPPGPRHATAAHRVPLGLLLLSREQLTAEQLRTALELQRSTGTGKIGEWLQQLGFSTETQITSALARQWSCPVLTLTPAAKGAVGVRSNFTSIPMALLEASQMLPAEFTQASGTLLMAFSEAVDHSALYAIEQMLGCRTEACFVSPGVLGEGLRALLRVRKTADVVFDRTEDLAECARIIGSYSSKLEADEVRLIRCGEHFWIRLERPLREAVNLVMRNPGRISPRF
jgi:hypothetical protein